MRQLDRLGHERPVGLLGTLACIAAVAMLFALCGMSLHLDGHEPSDTPTREEALLAAISHDDPEAVRQTWESLRGERGTETGPDEEVYPLAAAVTLRCPRALAQLLALHENLNEVTPAGYTPLMIAVQMHDQEMMQALLNAGTDPSFASPQGHTALQEAARTGDAALIQLLQCRDRVAP